MMSGHSKKEETPSGHRPAFGVVSHVGDRRDAENFGHAGRQLRVRGSRHRDKNRLWDTREQDNKTAVRGPRDSRMSNAIVRAVESSKSTSKKGSSRTMRFAAIGMPFLDQFRIEALPKKWADEGKLWQERYFPEMPEVFDAPNWSRHYPETPMPRLSVIMAKPDGFAGFAQKVVGATAATG